MSGSTRPSWLQHLIGILPWQSDNRPSPARPADEIVPLAVPAEQRRGEDWRDLLQPGQRVRVAWTAEGGRARAQELTVEGQVRLIAGETFWVWFDCDVPRDRCPAVGQAIQVLTPGSDALRLVPCRVVDETHGGSLQLIVSGRISRVQRREEVRSRVDLPPVSAVRLDVDDAATGL